MNYTIQVETEPGPEEVQFLWNQLLAYNRHYAIVDDYRRLTIFARNAADEIVGGVIGGMGWEWLHIDLLWVHESMRRQGLGSALLQQAEAEAIKAGCHHVHLDTMSFQAPGFYKKHGYTEFAMLPNHPTGHRRHFLMKALGAELPKKSGLTGPTPSSPTTAR